MMSKDFESPKFMENSIDFKWATVLNFFNVIDGLKKEKTPSVIIGEKIKVIILTNIGTVTGDLLIFNEELEKEIFENKDAGSLVLDGIHKASNTFMFNYEKEIGPEYLKVHNQTGRIYLKDVVIKPFSNPENICSLPRLMLFTDQIFGMSFGEETQL